MHTPTPPKRYFASARLARRISRINARTRHIIDDCTRIYTLEYIYERRRARVFAQRKRGKSIRDGIYKNKNKKREKKHSVPKSQSVLLSSGHPSLPPRVWSREMTASYLYSIITYTCILLYRCYRIRGIRDYYIPRVYRIIGTYKLL